MLHCEEEKFTIARKSSSYRNLIGSWSLQVYIHTYTYIYNNKKRSKKKRAKVITSHPSFLKDLNTICVLFNPGDIGFFNQISLTPCHAEDEVI